MSPMDRIHSKLSKRYIAGVALVVIGVAGYAFILLRPVGEDGATAPVACTQEAKICSDGSSVGREGPHCEFARCPKEELIVVESPRAYEEISSPVIVRGKARGTWFFEASFPVKVVDRAGNILGVVPVMTREEWMTTDFVSFQAEVPFIGSGAVDGFVIFEKDNPSGLSEHADELRVPVVFR